METQTFESSLDWSNELLRSGIWIAETFVITAVCVMVVLVCIARMTGRGRQFWRVSGDYFTGRTSAPVWAVLSLLLLSTIISVRVNVLLTYYVNDLFTSVQVAFQGGTPAGEAAKQTGISGFWASIAVFAVLAACYIVRLLVDMYITQRFIMAWRIWLSRRFIGDWLIDSAYFRSQFLREPTDNPDQRIQQDIDSFTTGVGGDTNNPIYNSSNTLLFGAIQAVLSVLTFGAILWRLSGPVTILDVTVDKALFWIVIGYVFVVTVIAFVIGRPLIRLSYFNELRNAGFRYALVRLRDTGAAVGLYRGENSEQRLLDGRLSAVMTNYRSWLNRMMLFFGWNVSMSQAINPLPWIVQAQSLFVLPQCLRPVRQLPRGDHPSRRDGRENRRTHTYSSVQVTNSPDGAVHIEGVDVRTPKGDPLVRGLDLQLSQGESLLISGPSGIGKSVLLQSLAGLWPFASGQARYPAGRTGAMFVPQLPYIPLGDLRAVVSYPHDPGAISDNDIQRALVKVSLSHLVLRINDSGDWGKTLSVGEQQRVAFARVLLATPAVVFLDESTSAMDEGLELMLYQMLRDELRQAILVSVSHRATVEQFHDRHLTLVGGGD